MHNSGKFTSVKLRDKISHKTDERPGMSLDMVGECILILLDCKSGNIERLLLRFCDENQSLSDKFYNDINLGTEFRREMFCLWTGGASIGLRTISGPLTPG